MKKILLLAVIINLSAFVAFSQINKPLKIDTTNQSLSIYKYTQPFQWSGSNDIVNIFKERKKDNHLFFLDKSRKPDKFPIIVYDMKSYDNMPCTKPEGFFSMRIYRPNTRYALISR